MEGGEKRALAAVVMVWWLATVAVWRTEAQQDTASCGSTLFPCANYLNATYPPSSCCDPLKDALTNQKKCLCAILNDTSLLSSFQINITQAQTLPFRCNITAADAPNICTSTTTSSTPSPATTTASSPGSGKNAAEIVAWSGVSIVLAVMASLFL